MAKLKEFRIDAFSYPMNSSHLIINGKGDVKTFSGMNVKISKIKKLQSFLQALDSALILDFKANIKMLKIIIIFLLFMKMIQKSLIIMLII